jgi:hypothetical protein
MADRWSLMLTTGTLLALLVSLVMPMPATALDLIVDDELDYVTPVTQILQGDMTYTPIELTQSEGYMGVYDIKALRTQENKATGLTPMQPTTATVRMQPGANPIQTVSVSPSTPYSPPVVQMTPTFVVFPVVIHDKRQKVFSDLPVMLSASVANQLSEQLHAQGLNISVINPLFAYDDLQARGLSGVYQKMMRDVLEAGRPHERDLAYLASELSTQTERVEWVVFVQADFDTSNLSRPTGLQAAKATWFSTAVPEPNYFVKGQVQIYSTHNGAPLIWTGTTSERVRMSEFGSTFTKSVYDDSDSAYNFKIATGRMAQAMVKSIPSRTYQTVSMVQASIQPGGTPDDPANITPQDQETLKRILKPE